MQKAPRFSPQTLKFIEKASRQKKSDWLDRNRADYERYLLEPLQHLARYLKSELAPIAPGYHFPQKGLGRLKRSELRAKEYGGLYKDWVSYSAARPRVSRFDHNPNLYFLLQPGEEDGDEVLVAGGLYMPSSRQLRSIREAIAQDASAFDRLFASKSFARHFPGGFSRERIATRPPRGFDPAHPRIELLKLQAFFVWKPYKKRDFFSADFPRILAADCAEIIKLNALLDQAIQGIARWREVSPPKPLRRAEKPRAGDSDSLASRLEGIEAPRRKMDF
jgi:uncharacterized protein (TIGR02453 family)